MNRKPLALLLVLVLTTALAFPAAAQTTIEEDDFINYLKNAPTSQDISFYDNVILTKTAEIRTDSAFFLDGTGTITIANGGTLIISGRMHILNNAVLENNGTVVNNGGLNNNGILNNNGALNNKGTVVNDGTLNNDGTLTGTVPFSGTGAINHAVHFNVAGGSGTLTAEVQVAGSISSGDYVPKNADVVFTAAPAAGFSVKEWTDNGTTVSATDSYTISGLDTPHTVTVEFVVSNTGSSTSSGSRSSGGGGYAATTAPTETWAAASDAENQSRSSGKYGVRGSAWAKLAGQPYYHDTMDGLAVQVRLYIDDPGLFTGDTYVSGYVKGADVERTRSRFKKQFKNELQVLHFDRQGEWEQPVRVAAKLDLTGMDTENLYFYAYDEETGKYRRIENPDYWIDKNGYLHFTTPYAGDIIISDGPLEKKQG